MAETDALKLCSAALVLLGEAPIDDFDSEAAAAQVAGRLYPNTARLMLAAHPWSFSRRVLRLSRFEAPPPLAAGYSAAYAMPPDCFQFEGLFLDGSVVRQYELAEGAIWCDAGPDQVAEGQFHGWVDESTWPPSFTQAVIYRLASDFALPITEDSGRQSAFFRLAETETQRARFQNATARPPVRMPGGSMMRARGR